jgi:hypothetical protein
MTLRGAWAAPALIVLVLPLGGAATAQQAPGAETEATTRSAIGDCARAVGGEPNGLAELEKRCPQLGPALQTAQLEPLIIASSRDRLDQHSLQQMQRLLHAARGPAPAVAALAPILHGARTGAASSRSWWQRLWDWLYERLSPKSQLNSANPWLAAVVRALARAHWLWVAIIWGTFIALPIAIIVIVVREVRAMGARSSDDPTQVDEARHPGPSASQLALLRRMPLAQRPAQLFALLIGRLVAAGRLPPDRSLTHREVVRRARLDDAEQRQFIESLARLSERQLYSGAATTPDGTEALLSRGEDLYTTGWSRPAEP